MGSRTFSMVFTAAVMVVKYRTKIGMMRQVSVSKFTSITMHQWAQELNHYALRFMIIVHQIKFTASDNYGSLQYFTRASHAHDSSYFQNLKTPYLATSSNLIAGFILQIAQDTRLSDLQLQDTNFHSTFLVSFAKLLT